MRCLSGDLEKQTLPRTFCDQRPQAHPISPSSYQLCSAADVVSLILQSGTSAFESIPDPQSDSDEDIAETGISAMNFTPYQYQSRQGSLAFSIRKDVSLWLRVQAGHSARAQLSTGQNSQTYRFLQQEMCKRNCTMIVRHRGRSETMHFINDREQSWCGDSTGPFCPVERLEIKMKWKES